MYYTTFYFSAIVEVFKQSIYGFGTEYVTGISRSFMEPRDLMSQIISVINRVRVPLTWLLVLAGFFAGFIKKKNRILYLLKKHYAINAKIVAYDLGISENAARAILFILTKEGKLRCDGYPRSSLYTDALSPENLALDHIRSIIETKHSIDWERRFVRVNRKYEVDAVFEAGDSTYLVEVKYIQDIISLSKLDHWLRNLLAVAKKFISVLLILL